MPPLPDHDFSDEDLQDLRLLLQNAALEAYPNPKREGCPGTTVLDTIARTLAPFKHPAYEHVKRCSPCLKEMLALREQHLSAKKPTTRKALAYAAALAAAALVAIGLWTARVNEKAHIPEVSPAKHNDNSNIAPQQRLQQPAPTLYAINLVGISRSRGSGSDEDPKPTTVPAQLLSLQITLPFGSDDGKYDIEIRKPGLNGPLLKTSGIARIKEGDTLLNISEFDLVHVPHGPYDLFFKHADASWQHAAILIE